MARNQSAFVQWSQYLAARTAAMALTSFDVDHNLRTAAVLGRLLHRFDHRHRERTGRHLRIAFPELDDAKIEHLARRSFEHFIQLVVEVCHAPRLIHVDSWHRYLRMRNLEIAMNLINAGRPAILVTGHLGNWEVLGHLMAVLGFRVDAIARPLDNQFISDWIYGVRERRGMRVITKWGATDRMLEVLDHGGMLAFIADQNAGDKGLFVPFFGRLASTYKSIGLLAMERDVPVICGYGRRLGGRFTHELGAIDIIHPQDWRSRRDPLYYITARYMYAIERMIRACPEQYLWMHRRWKSRPRFERLGKPMPPNLRRNLEELPWIDANTLERLMRTPQTAD